MTSDWASVTVSAEAALLNRQTGVRLSRVRQLGPQGPVSGARGRLSPSLRSFVAGSTTTVGRFNQACWACHRGHLLAGGPSLLRVL